MVTMEKKLVEGTGGWYLYNGRVDEGIGFLESMSQPDSDTLLWLGILHMKQGRDGIAEDYFRSAIPMAREDSDNSVVSICLSMLSRVNADRGDYVTALNFAQEAAEISIESEDRGGEALSFHARAYCQRISGDLNAAIEGYEAAMRIYQNEGDTVGLRNETRNLATATFLTGGVDEAAKLLRGLEDSRPRGVPYYEAYSHVDRAILAFIEGKYKQTRIEIEKTRRAIEACEQTLDPDEKMILDYLSQQLG